MSTKTITYRNEFTGEKKELPIDPRMETILDNFSDKPKAVLIFNCLLNGGMIRSDIRDKLDIPRTTIYDYIAKFKINNLVTYYEIILARRGRHSKVFFVKNGKMEYYEFSKVELQRMFQYFPIGRLRAFCIRKHRKIGNTIKLIDKTKEYVIEKLTELEFTKNEMRYFIKIIGDS